MNVTPPTVNQIDIGIAPLHLLTGLPAEEQAVLVWLWNETNRGHCWPTPSKIQSLCDFKTREKAVDLMRRLEERGLIVGEQLLDDKDERHAPIAACVLYTEDAE